MTKFYKRRLSTIYNLETTLFYSTKDQLRREIVFSKKMIKIGNLEIIILDFNVQHKKRLN